jgi:hypothetical protein
MAALNMNEITATVAGLVAPYTTDRLNAALYMYEMGAPTAYLEATFSRCRTEPRGNILLTLFPNRPSDEEAARARTWPFTDRGSMIEVLAGTHTIAWDAPDAFTLVFWRGSDFHPPAKVQVSNDVKIESRQFPDSAGYIVTDFMQSFHPTISFALPVSPPAGHVPAAEYAERSADIVVDKVRQFVGEMPKKKEEEAAQAEQGKAKKRKARA